MAETERFGISAFALYVPRLQIAYLGFGTESSTDNSAGAVIIKGMVDRALREEGRAGLSRHCEVPEHEHACLRSKEFQDIGIDYFRYAR